VTAADQSSGFADSNLARLLALAVAIALALLLWFNWSSDFKLLLADGDNAASTTASSEPAKPANPALHACLAQRVGDVDQMKKEGILSDAQYGAFRSRAEGLCRAQNPG